MRNQFLTKSTKLTQLGDSFIKKHGSKQFHKEAERLLLESNLHKHFDYEHVITEVFSKKFQVDQNFKALEFSDLPITISRGEHCFIDLYFWRRRPTTIHNHHFSGAFQCINGSNVDSEFKFRTLKKLTPLHSMGELKLVMTKQIKSGDVVAINLLDKFIHQNHHHADLTVNLCFRISEVHKKNLSNYLYSGFRYENDPRSILRAERLFALTRIQDFDYKRLNITPSDAITFLILNHRSNIQHPRFLSLKKYLEKMIKREFNLNIERLFQMHEDTLDEIQADYN